MVKSEDISDEFTKGRSGLKSEAGSVLVTGLILAAVLLIAATASVGLFRQQAYSIRLMNYNLSAGLIRANFQSLLSSTVAWDATLMESSNSSLACVRPPASVCTASPAKSIPIIRDGSGSSNPYYDTSLATQGFDMAGQVCNGFVAPPAAGNDDCPFRFEFTWVPLCGGAASCTGSPIEVTGTLVFNGDTRFKINPAKFTFTIEK